MKYNFNSSNPLPRRRYPNTTLRDKPEEESQLYLNTDFPQSTIHTSALQRFRRFQEKLHRGTHEVTPKRHRSDQFVVSAFTVAVVEPNSMEDPAPKFR